MHTSEGEAREARREAAQLLRCIRQLTSELRSLDRRPGRELAVKEQELERLRWRLAVVARRTGWGDAGAA